MEIAIYLWAAITLAATLYLFAPEEGWLFYLAVGASWPIALPIWIVVALEQRWAK
jgi:hypothetical protein